MNETTAILTLHHLPAVTNRILLNLMADISDGHIQLDSLLDGSAEELAAALHLPHLSADQLQQTTELADRLATKLELAEISVMPWYSRSYPMNMKHRLGDSAPAVLYAYGNLDLLASNGVGFCGSRNTSPRGLDVTRQLAGDLADAGITVVSGHARGVDEIAHYAALHAGGCTTIVLPTGLLHFQVKAALAEWFHPEQVVVVSQFQPEAGWHVGFAMQRNKTVCGLSHAMVIAESGTDGGTYNAGCTALKLRQPLFVFAYEETPPTAPGNRHFLERGAIPLPIPSGGQPDYELFLKAVAQGEHEPRQRDLFG